MRQGGDTGTQYRSAIYYADEAQQAAAEASRDAYGAALKRVGMGPITTEIAPAPDVLFRRGLSPGLSGQEPRRLLRHRRHGRGLSRRHRRGRLIMDRAGVKRFCLSLPAATLDHPFGEDHDAYRVGGKMFAIMGGMGGLSFKASDIAYEVLTETGRAIPAPYLARGKWVHLPRPRRLARRRAERPSDHGPRPDRREADEEGAEGTGARMTVLVLGATGLIGAHVAARLQEQGHRVVAGGRDRHLLERRFPDRWVHVDLAQADEARWTALLRDVDAVVNCAGALQDSLRDDLAAVHDAGVRALLKGCAAAGVKRYVHISAAGLAEDRATAFNRTKLAGEAAIRASGLNWIILRPGLVLAPTAYGGSALLRALAAFPLAIPAAWPDRVVQVIGMDDLGRTVAAALRPDAPRNLIVDVVHEERLPLGDLLRRLRRWLGHAPAPVLTVPEGLAETVRPHR